MALPTSVPLHITRVSASVPAVVAAATNNISLSAPFTGRVVQVGVTINQAVATADATCTTDINGTAMTGGVITVTRPRRPKAIRLRQPQARSIPSTKTTASGSCLPEPERPAALSPSGPMCAEARSNHERSYDASLSRCIGTQNHSPARAGL